VVEVRGVSGVAVGWAADAASGGACHNCLSKKKAWAHGIDATAKVLGEPSRSSRKKIDGKNKGLWLLLSVKKRNRLS
jgi:hypothetical protein